MNTLIHNARLLDPASGMDAMGGVHIVDGMIKAFGPDATAGSARADLIIDADGLCLSPGLIDLRVKTS